MYLLNNCSNNILFLYKQYMYIVHKTKQNKTKQTQNKTKQTQNKPKTKQNKPKTKQKQMNNHIVIHTYRKGYVKTQNV